MINELLKLCMCKVTFNSTEYAPNVTENGCYYWDDGNLSYSPNIQISRCSSEVEKLAVLAHEVGHAICDRNNCKCKADVLLRHGATELSEYHAIKWASKWLLDNKCKEAMKAHIACVEQTSLFNPTYDIPRLSEHTKAYRKIMKLKLWEKCKKFAESE